MKTIAMTVLAAAMAASAQGAAAFRAADYGIVPGNAFSAGQVARLVEDLRRTEGDKTLLLEPGRYDVGARNARRGRGSSPTTTKRTPGASSCRWKASAT